MKPVKLLKVGLGVLALSVTFKAAATEMLINGDFEAGNLSGWTQVTSNTSADCQTDWTVLSSDTICNVSNTELNNPPQGTFAAYNSFDGVGPLNYTIEQSVTLGSVGSATLSWQDSVAWDFSLGNLGSQSRIFSIDLLTASNALIGNIYDFSVNQNTDVTGFQDWTARSFDVTGLLVAHAFSTIKVRADVFIPQNLTGPGTLGLDDASLNVTAAVPAPATVLMLLVGFLGLAVRRVRTRV